MTIALFEGGPLDGQSRDVADHVQTCLVPEAVVEPGWEWSWAVGGFVWVGDDLDPPVVDRPAASYRNVIYRRDGDVIRMEDT